MQQPSLVIIGGGAAGYFAAIAAAENQNKAVTLYEKSLQPLAKVKVSGGGRCNVTHACFDPKSLIQHYPRGSKALLGPFHRFQPKDTVEWFESRGVALKTEGDGRMFPTTDSSQSIIDCLQEEAHRLGVKVVKGLGIKSIHREESQFFLDLTDESQVNCDCVLLASGSQPKGLQLAQMLGHTIVPPVPSLFTLHVLQHDLASLSGVSVAEAVVRLQGAPFEQTGALLITHWGFSGPAPLKLSAWAARYLHGIDYTGTLLIDWLPSVRESVCLDTLQQYKGQNGARLIATESPFSLPKQLWKALLERIKIPEGLRLASVTREQLLQIVKEIKGSAHSFKGKSMNKEEFVTCGGVALEEVNFKTMESRLCPGLYFAGEVLDIDGVTGGFNFQNAWTTGWIAGHAMAD